MLSVRKSKHPIHAHPCGNPSNSNDSVKVEFPRLETVEKIMEHDPVNDDYCSSLIELSLVKKINEEARRLGALKLGEWLSTDFPKTSKWSTVGDDMHPKWPHPLQEEQYGSTSNSINQVVGLWDSHIVLLVHGSEHLKLSASHASLTHNSWVIVFW
ncbi:hypothetical protein VNO77_04831 [Canavalia gladiata]|uniref:Uncharacterized protein n=1 Tax=Canavalia gladiata TaxID=3824 RepID=A0AAN9MX71_CANGL